jgi:hypothetical protein
MIFMGNVHDSYGFGIGGPLMSFGSATLGLILLGVTLRMRNATDANHVIAVTTILTRERRLISATRIGLVWDLMAWREVPRLRYRSPPPFHHDDGQLFRWAAL